MTVPILNSRADRLAWMLAGALCAACTLPAVASVHSDVVTASKYAQPAGPSAFAVPAQPAPVFLGKVLSVTGNTITIEGSLTAGALNEVDFGGVVKAQYVVKVRNDRSSEGNGTQGDWFTVQSNGANTVTVLPNAAIATATAVQSGDIVQIQKLSSIKDVFGSGAGVLLDKDNNFDTVSGDVVTGISGTTFTDNVIYHDGSLAPEGYWELNSGSFLGDGSGYTFLPGEMAFNFNTVGGDYEVTITGLTQCFTLSHYIGNGYNAVANPFAAPAPLGTCGLNPYILPEVAGFLPESNFDASSDAIFMLAGTAFADTLINHDGSLAGAGWWELNGGTPAGTYPLPTGTGFLINSTSPSTYIWRQPKP